MWCSFWLVLLDDLLNLFAVRKGYVEIRDWCDLSDAREHERKSWSWKRKQEENKLLTKTKLCWFHDHHPQGCPRSAHLCPYAHGTAELRRRPDFKNLDRRNLLAEKNAV